MSKLIGKIRNYFKLSLEDPTVIRKEHTDAITSLVEEESKLNQSVGYQLVRFLMESPRGIPFELHSICQHLKLFDDYYTLRDFIKDNLGENPKTAALSAALSGSLFSSKYDLHVFTILDEKTVNGVDTLLFSFNETSFLATGIITKYDNISKRLELTDKIFIVRMDRAQLSRNWFLRFLKRYKRVFVWLFSIIFIASTGLAYYYIAPFAAFFPGVVYALAFVFYFVVLRQKLGK